MADRLTMTVTMQVTPPQALALQAMFEHWNLLSGMGASRSVGFFVDGDGNFHPKCDVQFSNLSEEMPELTDDLRKVALVKQSPEGDCTFDFDPVAWRLHDAPYTGESNDT